MVFYLIGVCFGCLDYLLGVWVFLWFFLDCDLGFLWLTCLCWFLTGLIVFGGCFVCNCFDDLCLIGVWVWVNFLLVLFW